MTRSNDPVTGQPCARGMQRESASVSLAKSVLYYRTQLAAWDQDGPFGFSGTTLLSARPSSYASSSNARIVSG